MSLGRVKKRAFADAHLSKPRLARYRRRCISKANQNAVSQANVEGKLDTIQNSAIFEVQKYSKLLNVVQLVANGHFGNG
jgi:hypothetical protein